MQEFKNRKPVDYVSAKTMACEGSVLIIGFFVIGLFFIVG